MKDNHAFLVSYDFYIRIKSVDVLARIESVSQLCKLLTKKSNLTVSNISSISILLCYIAQCYVSIFYNEIIYDKYVDYTVEEHFMLESYARLILILCGHRYL